tara:strand:- start:398 stop:736 length:339 start_codon:yes stop_codon:yes gene_type:complete
MANKNPKFTGLGVYFHEYPNLVLTDSEFRYHNDVNPVFEYVDLQKDGSEKNLLNRLSIIYSTIGGLRIHMIPIISVGVDTKRFSMVQGSASTQTGSLGTRRKLKMANMVPFL